MDTNFDEKQAFEDLRGVLNHIYQFANYYYAEMQAAQNLNAEKDSELANLKNSYEEKLRAKDEKISALERNFDNLSKDFKSHLEEYGNYNLQLTHQLEDMKKILNARRVNLDTRADELQKAETKLKDDRAALDSERAEFDAYKNSVEDKLSNYQKLQEAAESFDVEKTELQSRINELEANQAANNDAEKIKQLEDEIQKLQAQIENLKGQLESSVPAENSDAEKIKQLEDENQKLQRQLESSVPAESFDAKIQELLTRIKQLEENQAANNDTEKIQQLEADRDYWKNRAENLQGQLEGNSPAENNN